MAHRTERSDRKKQLIAQGAVHRAEAMLARQDVQQSLQPEAIARSTLRQAMLIGMTALHARASTGLPGMNLQRILPLLTAGASLLARNKPALKVLLRGAAIAGSIAGLVRAFVKKRQSDAVQRAESADPSAQ